MTTRQELVNVAKQWLGTPFEHQGRSRAGIDCAGYLYMLALENNLETNDYQDIITYGRDPDRTMELILDKHLIKQSINQIKLGSILFFAFGRRGQHLGIVTDTKQQLFCHAFEPEKKVIETRLDKRWKDRFLRGVYDYYGLEDL